MGEGGEGGWREKGLKVIQKFNPQTKRKTGNVNSCPRRPLPVDCWSLSLSLSLSLTLKCSPMKRGKPPKNMNKSRRCDAMQRDATRHGHDTTRTFSRHLYLRPRSACKSACFVCLRVCVCMYVCMCVCVRATVPAISANDASRRPPARRSYAIGREREREREHFLNACVAAAVTLIVLPNRQVRLARSRRWPFVRCNRYEAQRQPATCRHRPLRHVFKNV